MKNNRKLKIAVVVVVIILALGISVGAAHLEEIQATLFRADGNDYISDDARATLYSYGQLYRELVEIRDDQGSVFTDDRSVTINEEEVANLTQQFELTGEREPYLMARNSLIRRQVLYLEAVSQGFEIANEDVYAIIEMEKEASRNAVNFEQFLIFLEGTQMTEYEYWMSIFDHIRVDLIISQYTDSLREQFLNENENLPDTYDIHSMFDNMLEEKIDYLIEKAER